MSLSLQKLKKRSPPEDNQKPVKKISRFNGVSEEEVKKNTLKDILEYDLDLVFVGINPSLMAAHTGRYYAGPGNHFYKLLYESKLVPEPITYEEDDRLLMYKIGLTNIVARATRSSVDLSKSEIKKGAVFIHDKLKKFKPKIAIFNGKCIYEEFSDKYDKSTFCFGLQPHKIGETTLWVVPSSSARCANFPRMQDKLHFYTSLKKYLAYLKGEIDTVDPKEFRFEGKCKQAVPSTSKMWRRKGISAFANGGRIANKETIDMNGSEENVLAVPRSTEFILKNYKEPETSESDKDSGISSQEALSQNKNKSTNTLTKRRQTNSEKKPSRSSKIITRQHNVERANTIDFIDLIKQRLNDKASKENEKKEEDIESASQIKSNVKGLKYANLRSNRYKQGFKIAEVSDSLHEDL